MQFEIFREAYRTGRSTRFSSTLILDRDFVVGACDVDTRVKTSGRHWTAILAYEHFLEFFVGLIKRISDFCSLSTSFIRDRKFLKVAVPVISKKRRCCQSVDSSLVGLAHPLIRPTRSDMLTEAVPAISEDVKHGPKRGLHVENPGVLYLESVCFFIA